MVCKGRARRFLSCAVFLMVLLLIAMAGGRVSAASPSSVTIVACGDIVPHWEVAEDARVGSDWDFVPIFSEIRDRISGADYAFCTLESAVAGEPYSYYPRFNAPEALLRDLKTVGFDLICLASNHGCDKGFPGIVKTIDACERQGLDHTGTYRTAEERADRRGILFRELNGITFAFLDYTSITNQYRMTGQEWSIRTLFSDFWAKNPRNLLYDEVEKDIREAREGGADVVIAVCHWGKEYQLRQAAYQTEMAEFMISHGVDILIGSHPHVPQPAETLTVSGEDGEERTGYVFYSLGNFLSSMTNPAGDITPLVEMRFEKDPRTGDVSIADVSYSPLYRLWQKGEARQFLLADVDAALSAWDAGQAPPWMYAGHCEALNSARAKLLSIVGEELCAQK